jgi:hypothetical protein
VISAAFDDFCFIALASTADLPPEFRIPKPTAAAAVRLINSLLEKSQPEAAGIGSVTLSCPEKSWREWAIWLRGKVPGSQFPAQLQIRLEQNCGCPF